MESLRRLGCSASQLGQISFPPPRPKCKAQNQPFPLSISPLSLSNRSLARLLRLRGSASGGCMPAYAPARPDCARRIACSARWAVAGGRWGAAGGRTGLRPAGLAAQAAPRHGGRGQSAGRRAVQARRPKLPSGRPSRRRPKQALQLCSTARAGAGNENISSSNAKC